MPKPCSHPLIEYMIEESGLTRAEVAKRIGATPKTLYYWEHQLTKVKGWMVAKVSEHTGISLESIPACVHKKALAEFERNYATRSEIKAGFKAKPKDEPPTHKRDVFGENAKAEAERKARQAAKATDPKRHRIPNFGYPTAANKNPSTFDQVRESRIAKYEKEGGIDMPSDFELPDLIATALEPLNYYEPVFVARHLIPDAVNLNRTSYTLSAFYWKRPDGKRYAQMTLDQAKALIAQQMAQDEAATADLI